ncbi:uncharacterized protein [Phaseolus vulgaris]|uniref:uncharacterized protein n=1 Tax=Phaseolus vulgaris TaxID=3885 RepID=UPI0035CBD78D
MAMDWFISLPDGHITSFAQLSQLFREQYQANRAPPPVSYDLFDVKQYQGETLKEYINRFGDQMVKVGTTEEPMIVYAFRKGVCPGPFCESIIRNRHGNFAEIRRRVVEHIATEGEIKCWDLTKTRGASSTFGHHINNCLALGHQFDELVKSGFLKDYLAGSATAATLAVLEEDQAHEMPIHGEVLTISGGFSGGGPTASQRKRYVRTVNSVVGEGLDDPWETDLVFTKADLRDVVPQDNDPVVISVVTAGRKVHRVLVDQGRDQVEVRGYLELRTTSTDGAASRTESIRYLVVNANSVYNILLGRPALNRLRAVASTRHMKMKLPDLSGKVIVIKSDKEEARKCYENSLKTKRGVVMVMERPPVSDTPMEVEPAESTRSRPHTRRRCPRKMRPEKKHMGRRRPWKKYPRGPRPCKKC